MKTMTGDEWAHVERKFAKLKMHLVALSARLKSVDTDPDFERSGCMACSCGFDYRAHPSHPAQTWLTVLCSGELVKL